MVRQAAALEVLGQRLILAGIYLLVAVVRSHYAPYSVQYRAGGRGACPQGARVVLALGAGWVYLQCLCRVAGVPPAWARWACLPPQYVRAVGGLMALPLG